MKIRVLGASGSETPGHNLTAFLIDGTILMDAGTVGQSLNIRKQGQIKYVLLTHTHLDHMKGLPFLLDNMNIRNTGHSVTIVSGRDVLTDMKKHIFNNRIWPDYTKIISKNGPILKFKAISSLRSIRIDGFRVGIERVNHTGPAYGFIIEDASKKAIAYSGDTGPTELFWKKMSRYDVRGLFVGVSFPDRMIEIAEKSGHLTPSLLGKEIEKMVDMPSNIYITHTKPPYSSEIKKEVNGLGLKNIEIIKEGQVLTV